MTRRRDSGPGEPRYNRLMANLLTLGRILLIVPFVALFLADVAWNMKAAFVIFAIAAMTDYFDGFVARRRNEASALGAALDPLADKLLIVAALLLLTRNGVIEGYGVVATLIIILREILVTGLREAVAVRGGALPVTPLAKWKTFAQLAAAGALLLSAPNGFVSDQLRPLGTGLLWAATLLTLWTGADYAARAARVLGDERG